MEDLDPIYVEKLEDIINEIQNSPLLEAYLEEEDELMYQSLIDEFEPQIGQIYDEVALKHPLQILSMEELMRHEAFEGLFLPRLLGFAVLRGETDANTKYVIQQDSFKDTLLAICNSPNFDILKKRIGQTLQIGLALSSDIWITNIIDHIDNKKIKSYLLTQKVDKYRDIKERSLGYKRYKNQFRHFNYFTCTFPDRPADLKINFHGIDEFLRYRIKLNQENQSFIPQFIDHIEKKALADSHELLKILLLIINFFDLPEDQKQRTAKVFNGLRASSPDFEENYFKYWAEILDSDLPVTGEADKRVSGLLDKKVTDELSKYYEVTEILAEKGFNHPDAIEVVRNLYAQYEGMSHINECLRFTILSKFRQIIPKLTPEEYHELFEASKLYQIYMDIFANQKFNQELEDISLVYIKKLLHRYTDKRGRDYQDIRKFVSSVFLDLNFMKEKEIVEMFKTKRKKKD